jgi:hypothetical protein
MDAISATAATASSTTDATPSTSATTDASPAKQSFATLFADAQKDLKSGEKLTKVDGHPFARIKGGERDAMCINLSGNGRSGQAFDLISRGGHQFHVYGGKGTDRVVVEVGKKPAATTTDAATSTTGTTSTPTTGSTGTTGTTGAADTSSTDTTASGAATTGTTASGTGSTGTTTPAGR